MSTQLFFGRDVQGYNAFAPVPSTNMFGATLIANTAESFTLPTNSKYWVISFSIQPGCDIWVDFTGATATVPVGATFSSTTVCLNPGARTVPSKVYTVSGGPGAPATISIITPNDSCQVGIELFVANQTAYPI